MCHFNRYSHRIPLKGFLEKYPELQVEFELSGTTTNIIGEVIDLAIRIGQLSDSSLISHW